MQGRQLKLRAPVICLRPWSLIRVAITQVLNCELLEPNTIEQAQCWAQRFEPGLAIVEPLAYPGVVLALSPLLPVLVLTQSTDERLLVQSIQAGASGFLHLSVSAGEFKDMVQSILEGVPKLSTIDVRRITEHLTQARQEFLNSPTPLTHGELEVLILLSQGHTNTEIAGRLSLAVGTIKHTCNRIFQKLGVRNRVEATLWAVRAGLVDMDK